MARTIVITSGKGGVGKTTLATTLGRMLGTLGFKVLLIDTDMGLNNLDVALNIENKVVFDIVDVINGKCRLKQAIVEDCVNGVFVLPSCHSYDNSSITATQIKALTDSLYGFDYCLIDCPAGIEAGFHRAVTACGESIVVTTPHLSALKDANKVIDILHSYSITAYCVLNRVRGDLIVNDQMLDPSDIMQAIKAPLIGVIPDSDSVGICLNTGRLLPRDNDAYKATMLLARNLLHGTSYIFDTTKQYKGILGKLKRALKKV